LGVSRQRRAAWLGSLMPAISYRLPTNNIYKVILAPIWKYGIQVYDSKDGHNLRRMSGEARFVRDRGIVKDQAEIFYIVAHVSVHTFSYHLKCN